MSTIIKANVYQFPEKKKLVENSPIVKQGDQKTSPAPFITIGDVLVVSFNLRVIGGHKKDMEVLKQLVEYMWVNRINQWVFSQEDWNRLSPKTKEFILE